LFITAQFWKDEGGGSAKKLIFKFLFQDNTYFLQSSKVGTFLETSKKSCFSEKTLQKIFISIVFVLIFVPSKQLKTSKRTVIFESKQV
jgi:hypothetical protein